MNKGFILDGYPRTSEDAKQVFMCADTPAEGEEAADQQKSEDPLSGFSVNQKIVPQFVILIEAEDAFLQQRAKEMPAEARAPSQMEPRAIARLKTFRDNNGASASDEKHLMTYFKNLIGEKACMLKIAQPGTEESQELKEMQDLLEQNGKPCCINLITDNDNKFLENLKKPATVNDTAVSSEKGDEMTEEEKAAMEAEAAEAAIRALEDEVDVKIRLEEEE
jgi:hypothetical protein